MKLIQGTVRPYAWGSRTTLAELRGFPSPSAHPEAELWFGAHPSAPSEVEGSEGSLIDEISANPLAQLGSECNERFGHLPFMLKVLAAEEPLSLQAHPSEGQAQEGFLRENNLGLPLDAGTRNYRDAQHKPELVVAVTPFQVLAGFRAPAETIRLLKAFKISELTRYTDLLVSQPDDEGLRALFTTWLTIPESAVVESLAGVIAAVTAYLLAGGGEFTDEAKTILEISERYPNDRGVLAVLLLNRIELKPGQGLFVPAGVLHAYLHGTAVEIMANSDNVLRGGLTPKHIDAPELLRILNFAPLETSEAIVSQTCNGVVTDYAVRAAEFALQRIELAPGESAKIAEGSPRIMLATQGAALVHSLAEKAEDEIPGLNSVIELNSGSAVWISFADGEISVTAKTRLTIFVGRVGC